MATKKQLSLIEPSDGVPGKKTYKQVIYDRVINEFLESGLEIARIKPIAGKTSQVYVRVYSEKIGSRKNSGKHYLERRKHLP